MLNSGQRLGLSGVIWEYFKAGVIEFHPGDEQDPVKLSFLGNSVRGRLVPDYRERAGFTRAATLVAGAECMAG